MNNFQMSNKFKRMTIALNEEMYGRLLRMARMTSCGAYEMENGEVSHAIPAISPEQFATELLETKIVEWYNEKFAKQDNDKMGESADILATYTDDLDSVWQKYSHKGIRRLV